MSGSVIFTNATIITLGAQPRVLHEAACRVEDGIIRDVGPAAELLAKASPEAIKMDCGGRVLMPGQINAHDHLYSAFARGIALKDEPPQNFEQILQRLWWRLDAALTLDDVYLSGMLGFTEAVQRGVTTIVDHHASPGCIDGSLDKLAEGALQVGLRTCLCYETTDRHGDAGARAGIAENLRFARHCAAARDARLSAAMGLHASITVGPETLTAALRSWPADVPVHVHVAEDGCDVRDSETRYGKPPLRRLLDEGLAEREVWAAHCIHLREDEVDLLAQHRVTVLHNPRSNLNNAVGCAPVKRMLSRGIAVALGTDGMSQDPSEDARTLAVIHKHQAADPQAFSFADIYDVAFVRPARLASRRFGCTLGEIAVGAAADLMVLDYDPPTPLTSDNFLGHWLFGMSTAPCWGTWVNGTAVYLQGEISGVDLMSLKGHTRRAAEELWKRW
jgi:putative selenium metabolism protein SsnA